MVATNASALNPTLMRSTQCGWCNGDPCRRNCANDHARAFQWRDPDPVTELIESVVEEQARERAFSSAHPGTPLRSGR